MLSPLYVPIVDCFCIGAVPYLDSPDTPATLMPSKRMLLGTIRALFTRTGGRGDPGRPGSLKFELQVATVAEV